MNSVIISGAKAMNYRLEPESSQILAVIAFRAARKSGKNLPAASKFVGNQHTISDSTSLLELSDSFLRRLKLLEVLVHRVCSLSLSLSLSRSHILEPDLARHNFHAEDAGINLMDNGMFAQGLRPHPSGSDL